MPWPRSSGTTFSGLLASSSLTFAWEQLWMDCWPTLYSASCSSPGGGQAVAAPTTPKNHVFVAVSLSFPCKCVCAFSYSQLGSPVPICVLCFRHLSPLPLSIRRSCQPPFIPLSCHPASGIFQSHCNARTGQGNGSSRYLAVL